MRAEPVLSPSLMCVHVCARSVLDLPTCEEERDMHGSIMFRVSEREREEGE